MREVSQPAAWRDYLSGLAWQQAMGLSLRWPECVRFYEGIQWPAPTPATKSLPRPVFNFIRQIIRTKKSNILEKPVSLVFSPAQLPETPGERSRILEGAGSFTEFSRLVWEELGQDALNDILLETAATMGCGVLHYYWDTTASEGEGSPWFGAIRGEVLDPADVFFGDPQETDIQRQPWVLIAYRRPAQELKAEAARCGGDAANIRPDTNASAAAFAHTRIEMPGSGKATCVLRYFKKDGSVWWEKATASAMVAPPRPLHPEARMPLYPLEAFSWEPRRHCIYGLGEVEALMPNQKLYNFLIAMMGLSAQQTAWPRMIVRAGALQQGLTNEPGEVVTDYSGGTDGVKFLDPPAFSELPRELAGLVLDSTRDIAGVNKVLTGETVNLAASAILALQNQAKLPVRNIQERFYRSVKAAGRIWEQFFKACAALPRAYLDGGESRLFEGVSFAETPFDLRIRVGPGTSYSESLCLSTLEMLLKKGVITAAQYARYAPESVLPSGLRGELEGQDAKAEGVPA